ncbi:MAG: YraN family protein [Candidatus Omnitrophota bacterium]
MSRTNQGIGKLGEGIAEKFLTSRGYKVLHRNFTTPFGEIDIVATQRSCTVFFEVKTRISEKFGSPLSSITRKKQKHILRNCQFYLKRRGLCGVPCRIDAISINLDQMGELKILRHVKNAIIIKE